MKATLAALLLLFGIGAKVKESRADDGRIDWKESMVITMKALGLITVFKTLPAITAELKTATPEQKLKLLEDFKENFDLANDVTEENIEAGIEVLVNLQIMLSGKG